MKTLAYLILYGFLLVVISHRISGQDDPKKTDTIQFRVEGVCTMCKTRIENAVMIKGVKFAEWNKESHMLTVIFRTGKVDQTELEQAVAEAGHDTENEKASENAYNKLPGCCAYRDHVNTH